MQALSRTASILLMSGVLSAHAADRNEKTMVSYVKSRQDSAVALLEQAVNINSGTMNFKGVREVGELFRPRFEALGFKTEWVDGASFGRAGHLVARDDRPERPSPARPCRPPPVPDRREVLVLGLPGAQRRDQGVHGHPARPGRQVPLEHDPARPAALKRADGRYRCPRAGDDPAITGEPPEEQSDPLSRTGCAAHAGADE